MKGNNSISLLTASNPLNILYRKLYKVIARKGKDT